MQSGYKIIWSDETLQNLLGIIEYLEYQWTKRELNNFIKKLDKRINLIAENPHIFPASTIKKNIRKSVLTKQTSIYYQIGKTSVEIISLFDNRSNPKNFKLTRK